MNIEDSMTKSGYVVLTFQFEQEDDAWVGKCVELGTATWAESLTQLEEELRDLVGLHLTTLQETGRLGQVLNEYGVKMHEEMPSGLSVRPQDCGDGMTARVGCRVGEGLGAGAL